MARRSTLWTEIARDRELRQRQNARAVRVHQQVAKELATDAARARQADDRDAKARERERIEAERHAGLNEADNQNARLEARVDELAALLKTCVSAPPVTVEQLTAIQLPPFVPGPDGVALEPPERPVMQDGGLLSRSRRRREYEQAVEQYASAFEQYKARDRGRVARLEALREAHRQHVEDLRAAAVDRAANLRAGLRDGVEAVVEEFAVQAIAMLQLPDGIGLEPKAAYRRDPREIVVDIQLPDTKVLPTEKSVKYVHVRRSFTVKERSRNELANMYGGLLATLPLCVAQLLFSSLDAEVLDSVTVNGILPTADRATGRPVARCLVSVTTSRSTFDELVLDSPELDPVLCMRELGAKLSPHPLDYEEVLPFLTFELAKYRLDLSVDVAAGMDGRVNLSTMDWGEFEQLIRQLLQEMTGADSRVTRRSKDDGIDGVVFDCNAVLGGEFIVQAKRYRNVVPANDVRALAGVMHDKRANHAIFVTTAWFSDDGRRFALDNRVRLVEGPELKHLLRVHLGLDVLVPSARRRRRAGANDAGVGPAA
ncbi:restriction endonuclease [Pseudonocardia charpentierae]|uniref:Restriction endonuclease n=1 Tax=Pseudonocardia charpentierae TaxID=3075545 RepID=A0ABU2NDK1_9PSEU|nr:restriction endonuclease [Pseudonocardia sp. DSM 45834]MDT0351113.1 restriction endonuclease [Pseudonocardia sp. DSM 45834]